MSARFTPGMEKSRVRGMLLQEQIDESGKDRGAGAGSEAPALSREEVKSLAQGSQWDGAVGKV